MWIQFCSNFGCAIRIGITNTLVRLLLKSNSGYSYHMVAVWIQYSSDFGSTFRIIVIISALLRSLMKSKSAVSYRMFAVWIQLSSCFGCAIIHIETTIKHIPKVTVEVKMCWFLSYLGSLIYSLSVVPQCSCPCPGCSGVALYIMFEKDMRSWPLLKTP